MKRILPYLLITATACFCLPETSHSQQVKIGVYDTDMMVQALPAYAGIDSLMEVYGDDLKEEYEMLVSEYRKLDSIQFSRRDYICDGKVDSSIMKRQELGLRLVYWQQIMQKKDSIQRRRLAGVLYEKVQKAFNKVVSETKYDLIVKPYTVELNDNVDNLFIAVAKELGLSSLPDWLLKISSKGTRPFTEHSE